MLRHWHRLLLPVLVFARARVAVIPRLTLAQQDCVEESAVCCACLETRHANQNRTG